MDHPWPPDEVRLAEAVKRALLEMHAFALCHRDAPKPKNLQEFLKAEAFSPGTASFLQGQNVNFYGTSADRIPPGDLPVIEVVGGEKNTCRWIGFADGHVERVKHGEFLKYVLLPTGTLARQGGPI